MTEPVAWRYKNVNQKVWCVSQMKPDDRAWGIIEPLYMADQLQSKIQLTNSEYELLAKVCRGISPFNKIESNIEIVPDMKWFVRSKEKDNGHYLLLAESRIYDMPRYTIFKHYATQFDTKEQAELWTNPLTEAVQLPVDDE